MAVPEEPASRVHYKADMILDKVLITYKAGEVQEARAGSVCVCMCD